MLLDQGLVKLLGLQLRFYSLQAISASRSIDKIILLITLSIFFNISWSKCISGNCSNGYGTFTYPDGNKYVGQWQNKWPILGTEYLVDERHYSDVFKALNKALELLRDLPAFE